MELNNRFESLDQFMDRLEDRRLRLEGHDFTELDRESRLDYERNRPIRSLERVIERL